MASVQKDILLGMIRKGQPMTLGQQIRLTILLSLPAIAAQFSSVLMQYIDAAMVGHLGATASASIGLVETTTWLMGSILSAASLGFSVQVAHFIGANDFTRARQVFRHALVCGGVVSVLMALAGVVVHTPLPYWLGGRADIAPLSSAYFLIFSLTLPAVLLYHLMGAMLKSAGEMRVPSVLSILMCSLDVAFNYLFIYLLKMGVTGAALGTMSAYVVTVLPMAWQAVCKNKIIALRLDREQFVWKWAYVRNALKISLPVAVQNILMGSAQVVSTLIVAPLGNVAIAANSFAITAESLCYMPGYGVGDAASTLVGQTYGAGRRDLCKSFAHLTIGVGMLVMALMGVVMYVLAPEMIGFLSPVEAIRQLGAEVLRIEAFAEPFFAAAIVSYAVCVAAGDTLRPAAMSLFSMWCVRLTLAYALAQSHGLRGVWIAMATELTFRGCIFLWRIRRGSWLKGLRSKEA